MIDIFTITNLSEEGKTTFVRSLIRACPVKKVNSVFFTALLSLEIVLHVLWGKGLVLSR